MTTALDVYDHELADISTVYAILKQRYEQKLCNYLTLEREARERFGEIGFEVVINWYSYGERVTGLAIPESASPEIIISGRIDRSHVFDHDRQVHEVTHNLLGLPEEDAGVIKTDQGDSFKRYMDGQAGHGHGHGHSH